MRRVLEIVRDQHPVTLPPTATVKRACQAMRDRRVGAVLVVEHGTRLAGIFTGRDAVCRVLAEGRDPARTRLAQVMTCSPDTMTPGKTALEAARQMLDGGYRHLPVVEGDRLIGIMSRMDIKGLEQARLDEETGLWERI